MLLKLYSQSLNHIFVRSKPVMRNLRPACEFFATRLVIDKNIKSYLLLMRTKYYAPARFYLYLKRLIKTELTYF